FFQAEDGIRDDLVTGVQTCLFRSRADDMNAQKLEALGIEQELQQALLITEHLALGQLGVLGDARLVGYFRRGQLLLGLTDHRDRSEERRVGKECVWWRVG